MLTVPLPTHSSSACFKSSFTACDYFLLVLQLLTDTLLMHF